MTVPTGCRYFLNSGETNSQGLKGVWRTVHCEKKHNGKGHALCLYVKE